MFYESTCILRTLLFSSSLAACLHGGCQMDDPEDTEQNAERTFERNLVWTKGTEQEILDSLWMLSQMSNLLLPSGTHHRTHFLR